MLVECRQGFGDRAGYPRYTVSAETWACIIGYSEVETLEQIQPALSSRELLQAHAIAIKRYTNKRAQGGVIRAAVHDYAADHLLNKPLFDNDTEETALHVAVKHKHSKLVTALIRRGAATEYVQVCSNRFPC